MNPRVLWIDDQLDVIKTLSSLLAPLNAEVTCVGSAMEAMKLLEDDTYDLMLVDLDMPPGKWGGLWFLDAVARSGTNTPIIVVSGEGSQQETIKALRLGALDYVTKESLEQDLVSRATAVLSRFSGETNQASDGTRALIATGENNSVEFKSTLRWNIRAQKIDASMELAILKSIAGFMNSRGGTLLVGINDKGEIHGLDDDRFQDEDKLQLHFWNRVRDCIGSEHSALVRAVLEKIDGKNILRVDCRPSRRPVYVRWRQSGGEAEMSLFFVRTGPKTESLDIRQAVQYIADHFNDTR